MDNLTEQEELEYLRLKKAKAQATQTDPTLLSNQIEPGVEPGQPSFMQGLKAGLTAQPGEGVGHFIGAALPAAVGGAALAPFGLAPVGAALGETIRQGAGAVVNPEATAKKSPLAIGAEVAGAGVGQKAGEMAGPIIGKATTKAGEAFKSVSDWFASKVGKSFLKASKSINSYGHEPAKAITQEGIIATSWDDLITKAKESRKTIGKEIDDVLGKYPKDRVVNAEEALSPIDDAIEEASKMPSENATVIDRLEGLKKDVLGMIYDSSQKGKGLGIKAANDIKKTLYNVTKYTGNPSDDIILNKVKQDTAREFASKIEDIAPEIKAIHKRYGNVSALENAATNRAVVAERADVFGLPEMFATGIAGVGGVMGSAAGLAPAAGLVLASRGLKTPIGATAAMQASTAAGNLLSKPQIASIATKIAEMSGGALSVPIIEQILEEENKTKK